MSVDNSELRALANDLARMGASVIPAIRPVVARTMVDTKKELREEAKGVAHVPLLPYTINYSTRETRTSVVGEVGPDTDVVVGNGPVRTPGSFALLYFGNSKTGPVLKDPLFAMQRNAKKAEPFFLKVLGDLL